eukprot:1155806-Rhodomonas_salina.2
MEGGNHVVYACGVPLLQRRREREDSERAGEEREREKRERVSERASERERKREHTQRERERERERLTGLPLSPLQESNPLCPPAQNTSPSSNKDPHLLAWPQYPELRPTL